MQYINDYTKFFVDGGLFHNLVMYSNGWKCNCQILLLLSHSDKQAFGVPGWRDRWFSSVYLTSSWILFCNVSWTTLRSVLLMWIVVSSANSSHNARRYSGRTLTYIEKSKRPALNLVTHHVPAWEAWTSCCGHRHTDVCLLGRKTRMQAY